MTDYLALLKYSHAMVNVEREQSRLEWLSENIFNFTTYDSSMAELFAVRALEVCRAITESKTFEYIEDLENYRWYLTMVNMPFFSERINWGTSIRGAWWDVTCDSRCAGPSVALSCELWEGDTQITSLTLAHDEWLQFVSALVIFGSEVPA